MPQFRMFSYVIAGLVTMVLLSVAHAQTYFWNPANTTTLTWDTTAAIWSETGTPGTYTTPWVNTVPGTTDRFATFSTTNTTALTVSTTAPIVTSGITFGSNNFVIANGTGGSLTLSATTTAASPTINTGTFTNTMSAVLTGTVGFNKTGTGILILSGANGSTLGGTITVSNGTLRTGSTTALGTAETTAPTNATGLIAAVNATNIVAGATLDVNGQNLGAEVVRIAGIGIGGNGAIVNTGGDQTQALRYVQLGADANVGGTGRFDIRGTPTTAILDLGGLTLTKVGNNAFSIVGTTVTDGNLTANAGVLSIETTSLVQGTGTIRLNAGATLQFFQPVAVNVTRDMVWAGANTVTDAGTTGGVNSNISLSTATTTFNNTGTFTLGGTISGTGSLSRVGAGSLVIGGTTSASFAPNLGLITSTFGTLRFDNGPTFLVDRLNANPVTLSNSTLAVVGNATTGNNTSLTGGTLTVNNTPSVVTITATAGTETRTTFASLLLNGLGTAFFTSNTGTGITGLSGNGTTTVTGIGTAVIGLTAAPTLFGAGATTGSTRSILPGVVVLNGGTNLGTLASYDVATSTIYPLVRGGADYLSTTTFAGVTADNNVFVSGTATVPVGTTTMNSLFINIQDVTANVAGSVLKVDSGMVLLSDTSSSRSYALGLNINTAPLALDFNGQTGRIVLSSSTNFAANREYSVNANVTNVDAAGLLLTGSYGNTLGLRGLGNAQGSTTIQGINLTGALTSTSTVPFQVNFRSDANLGTAAAGVTLNNATLSLRGSQPDGTEAGAFATFASTRSLTLTPGTLNGLGVDTSNLLLFRGSIPPTTATLTKSGLGTLVLMGTTTSYTGGTNITGGTLQLGAGGTTGVLGTGTVALSNGATLAYGRSNTLAVSQLVTGAGNVQVLSGTLQLTAASNSLSGDTTVYGGTLALNGGGFNNGSVIGSGKLYAFPGTTVTTGTTHIFGNNTTGTNIALLGGTFSTNGNEFYVANIEFRGGTLTTSGAATAEVRAGGSRTITVYPASVESVFNLRYNPNAVGTTTSTFAVSDGTVANDLSVIKAITSGGSAVNTTTTPAIRKLGAGTMRYAPITASTYTGATEFGAGTFLLDFSGTGVPATNPMPVGSVPLFSGGTFAVTGATAASAQTLSNPTINAGGSAIRLTPGTGALTLTFGNTWTRSPGGTLQIELMAGGTLASSPTLVSDILGYATVNGTDFATVVAGAIAPYAGYTTLDGTTITTSSATYLATDTVTLDATTNPNPTINGLKITTATAGGVLDLSGQAVNATAGGILFTGADTYTVQNGTLAGGAGVGLIVHNNGAGPLTLNATLSTGAGSVTFAGTGTTILGGTQTRTGTSYLNGGIVQFSALADFGAATSPIAFGGGTLRWASGTTADITAGRGAGAVTIGNGGATLDTNGNNVTLATALGTSTGTLTKTGAGTLAINVANPNFSGPVVVSGGTLSFNVNNALGTGNVITINSGATLLLNNTNVLSAGHTTPVTKNIFVNGGTLQNGTGFTGRIGNVWLNGGTIQSANGQGTGFQTLYFGTLSAAAGTTGAQNGSNATITVEGTAPSFIQTTGSTNAAINLGPNVQFIVNDVTSSTATDLTITTPLANQSDSQGAAGGLTKRGAGTVQFSGINTFSGGMTVAQGTILGGATNAFGVGQVIVGDPTTPAASSISILATTQSGFASGFAVSAYTTGTVTIGSGNGANLTGVANTQFSGPITLARDVILQAGSTDRTSFAGAITGTGNVTITSPFTAGQRVTFEPSVNNIANTFVGNVTVTADAVLQLGAGTAVLNRAMPDASIINFESATSLLRLSPSAAADFETIGALNSSVLGAGVVNKQDSAGLFTLTVGGGNASGNYSGTIINGAGSLALVKTGTGIQTLSGASTYSGGTTVSGGTLRVLNTAGTSATGTGAVAVNSGTLSGTGTVAGAVTIAGGSTFRPGDAGTGTLTIGSDLILAQGSTFALAVNSTASTGSTAYALTGAGSLSIDQGTLVTVDYSAVAPGSFDPALTYSYKVGQSAATQNLTGITPPTQITTSGYDFAGQFNFSISGDATGGLYLNMTPVPEPATILGILALALGGMRAARRRSRAS